MRAYKLLLGLCMFLVLINSGYAQSLTYGLVAQLNGSCSGTTCFDSTGKFNVTISNSAIAQSFGVLGGNSFKFIEASSQYANFSSVSKSTQIDLSSLNEFSFSLWVNRTAQGTDTSYVGSNYGNCGASKNFLMSEANVLNSHSVYFEPAGQNVVYTNTIALGTPQHYVWVINKTNNSQILYLNGTAVKAGSATSSSMTGFSGANCFLMFGGGTTSGNRYMNGFIDEFAFWNRTLTASEVSTIYTAEANGTSYPWTPPTPPASPLAVINQTFPSSPAQYNRTNNLNFWQTANITQNNVNVSLLIDGSIIETQTKNAGTNVLTNFTLVTSTQGTHTWYTQYKNITSGETINSSSFTFHADTTQPSQINNFVNGSEYAKLERLITQINISDNLNVYAYEILLDTTRISNATGLSGTTRQVNISYLLNETAYGIHNLTINITDGVISGLYTNITQYQFNINRVLFNITANLSGGAAVSNFTAIITSTNPVDSQNSSTTTGIISFRPYYGYNYSIFLDAAGYAYAYANQTTTDNFLLRNIALYITNQFFFTFKNEATLAVMNGYNITIDLISDTFAQRYNITTGYFNATLLVPGDYSIRYSSPGFYERLTSYSLSNRSYVNLTLFLLQNSTGASIETFVYDQTGNPVENAVIKVKKYSIIDNAYSIIEQVTTNFEGKAFIHPILNTEYYKFTIEYGGIVVKETNPSYIYNTDDIVFYVVLGGATLEDYYEAQAVSTSLTYNNNTLNVAFTYNDAANSIYGGLLECYGTFGLTKTLIGSTSVNSPSSTILMAIPAVNQTIYNCNGYILGSSATSRTLARTLTIDDYIFDKLNNPVMLFLMIILTMTFALIVLWDMRIAAIMTPLPMFFFSMLGFVSISKGLALGFVVLGIIVAYLIKREF